MAPKLIIRVKFVHSWMSSSRIGGLVVMVPWNGLLVHLISHHVIFSCGVTSSQKSMEQGHGISQRLQNASKMHVLQWLPKCCQMLVRHEWNSGLIAMKKVVHTSRCTTDLWMNIPNQRWYHKYSQLMYSRFYHVNSSHFMFQLNFQ